MQYPWGPVDLRVRHRRLHDHPARASTGRAGRHSPACTSGTSVGRMVLGINEDGVYQILLVGACFVVLGFVAELFRAHRDRVMAAARTRKEAELRRAGEERLRIAQELHDVVAHHISLINVQAAAALHLVDRQPEQAGPALSAIKDASKEALVELRSIVGDPAAVGRVGAPAAGRRARSARAPGQPDVDGRAGGAHDRPRRPAAVADRPGPRGVPHHPGVADQHRPARQRDRRDRPDPVRRPSARTAGGRRRSVARPVRRRRATASSACANEPPPSAAPSPPPAPPPAAYGSSRTYRCPNGQGRRT